MYKNVNKKQNRASNTTVKFSYTKSTRISSLQKKMGNRSFAKMMQSNHSGSSQVIQKMDPAGKHKKEKLQKFESSFEHLAGERNKDGDLVGGHLVSSMREKWKQEVEIQGSKSDKNGVFEGRWRLNGEVWKNSTFFPLDWSLDRLKYELENAQQRRGIIVLPSGIVVQKAGDTFYPKISVDDKNTKKKKNKKQVN
ncbi:EndoU domain-containing protein [Candidatus Uabimicrobium sp. HlEnr_7]|uniref:EndoU domain-containing protein n=1 Tax=Candidatus Uabimicrobium helgolandensis TaxID=3095367 RepID=UPI0035564D32